MKKVHKTPTGMEKEERRREKSFGFSFSSSTGFSALNN